jgi:hypothetical protein
MIPYQPRPHVPPISFFNPISVDPKDMMTSVEYLLGILKKLNETIKQVNDNTEFINNYAGKIEKLEAEIAGLRNELETFEADISVSIQAQFLQIKSELESTVAAFMTQANAYTDAVAAQLREEIRAISVGAITVYDPSTGILSPLQTVIDNLYGQSRDEALTATEYDALELTATNYDAEEITAFNYDRYGKTILSA